MCIRDSSETLRCNKRIPPCHPKAESRFRAAEFILYILGTSARCRCQDENAQRVPISGTLGATRGAPKCEEHVGSQRLAFANAAPWPAQSHLVGLTLHCGNRQCPSMEKPLGTTNCSCFDTFSPSNTNRNLKFILAKKSYVFASMPIGPALEIEI